MGTNTKIRDWEKFLRTLDDDPIQTVITHLTHDPPLIHIIRERQRLNLTIDQIRQLHSIGKLPDPVASYLTTQGVLGKVPVGPRAIDPERESPQRATKLRPG